MAKYLLTLVVIAIVAAAVVLFAGGTPDKAEADTLRPVFINLTSGANDRQKASMALVLADNSLKSGRSVTVYFNVHGVKLADAKCELAMYKRDTLFREYLAEMIDQGLTVIACPYCMEKNNLTPDDLLDGIEPASGENFFPPIDDGAAVFSY